MDLAKTIPANREAGLKFATWRANEAAKAALPEEERAAFAGLTPLEYLDQVVDAALDSYEAARSAYTKEEGLRRYDAATPEQQMAMKQSLGVEEPWLDI